MTEQEKIYAARNRSAGAGIKFYFHAANQEDADRKISSWNTRHGFSNNAGGGWHIAVEVEYAPEDWIYDEYVS